MKKPLESTIQPGDAGAKDPDKKPGEEVSGLNTPNVDPKTGKPTQKAISSFKQSGNICKRLFDRHRQARLVTNGTIMRKYGGDAPYDSSKLEALNQGWRNNFSTGFIGSVIDRATPQITDPIKQVETLTFSTLPAERKNASEKTRKFRVRTTSLIRGWPGWINFVTNNAQQVYIFGNAAPVWMDKGNWRPKQFRTDQVFLPDGTGQHASQAQFIVIIHPIALHEFLDKISDPEAAKDAGYDMEGCAKAANEAAGLRTDGDLTDVQKNDAVREESFTGTSHNDADSKTIWLQSLIVREYDGSVALWTTSKKGQYSIRHIDNLGDTMEDVTTLFTLQTGNETFYGSKGAGRMLVNLHIAIERLRNLAADQVYLSGLPIITSDDLDMNAIDAAVRHPFIILPKGCTVAKEGVSFSPDAFQWMERNLVEIAESIAGAFIPPKIENDGSPNTKIEAAQKAEREMAVRNGVLGRYFGNFSEVIGTIQRKAYSPENLKEGLRIFQEQKEKEKKGITVLAKKVYEWLKEVLGKETKNIAPQQTSIIADEEAVQTIVALLNDGLEIQDITELALSQARAPEETRPEEADNAAVQFCAAKSGNPYYDQRKLEKMMADLSVGEDRANMILQPEQEDPNVEAVAYRTQVMEMGEMTQGHEMPVAITDVHRIHRKVMLQQMTSLFTALEQAPSPDLLQICQLFLQHYSQHLSMDTETLPATKEQEVEGLKGFAAILKQAQATIEKQAEEAAKAGINDPNQMPPPVGAPQGGGVGSPEAPAPQIDPKLKLEADKNAAEVILRTGDQKLKAKELELKQQDLDQTHQREGMKMATNAMQNVSDQAVQATKEGIASADQDLAQERQIEAENERTRLAGSGKPPAV